MLSTESNLACEMKNSQASSHDEGAYEQSLSDASDKDFTPSSPSSETSKEADHDGRFFDKLYSIPLVAESLELVTKYANNDDSAYSKYVKFALDKAEFGFNKVTVLAESKFPNQVGAADHMAVSTLEYLEDKFPLVLKSSSSDVYNTSRQAFSEIVTTPKFINSTIDSIATNAEVILDRFLPPSEQDEEDAKDVGVARLRHVGAVASTRLTQVVRSQIDQFSSTTGNGSILNLQESRKLLQRASEEVATLNEKLFQVVNNTKDNVTSLKDSSLQYLQKSQTTLISRIHSEIETVSVYFRDNAGDMPEAVRKQLEPTINFFGEKYSKVSAEIQKEDQPTTIKARNALLLATESVPYIDNACRYLTSFLDSHSSSNASE